MKRFIAFLMFMVVVYSSQTATLDKPGNSADIVDNRGNAPSIIDPKQFSLDLAIQTASHSLQHWFTRFGTAKVDISGGRGFQSSSIDILVPLYDTQRHLYFMQVGARRSQLMTPHYRTTMNVGAGYRYFTDGNWMLGMNGFYDQDMMRHHQRIGVGAEVWTDFLELSANGYLRLSEWKISADLPAYRERPANGGDIRIQGYLARYPQLGGKVLLEQYFGNEVGLLGVSRRQMNPRAVTLGTIWTPFPMLNLSLDHRLGQGRRNDTRFKIEFNFTMGVPLHEQLRSRNVTNMRKLKSARYRLVERSNEMVLEYKKAPLGEIRLPTSMKGLPATILAVPVWLKSDAAIANFSWSGSAASFALPYVGGDTSVTLPAYVAGGLNDYVLQLLATDAWGRLLKSNVMHITVEPLTLSITRSKEEALANGVDTVTFTARLLSATAAPMANRQIIWTVRNATLQSSSDMSDEAGTALAVVSKTISGIAEIEAIEVTSSSKATSSAAFIGDIASARVISLTASPTSLAANGTATSILMATVTDDNGNPVGAGATVNWTASLGTLAAFSSATNASGIATVVLTAGTSAGTAYVTAKGASGDPGQALTLTFTADPSTAHVVRLTAEPNSIAATGRSTSTLTATVTDANGNAVGAGVPVNWTTTLGTLTATTTNTNTGGIATVVLTSGTITGTATVSAHGTASDTGQTIAIAFTDTSETRYSAGNRAELLVVAATNVSTGTISFFWDHTLIGTATYAGYANQSCANPSAPRGFPSLTAADAIFTISSCTISNAGAGYTMYLFGLTRTAQP